MIEFIELYGWAIAILAMLVIFLIGLLKFAFKDKIEKVEKEKLKPVYEITSGVLVFIVVALYLVFKFYLLKTDEPDWSKYLELAAGTYAAVKVMYPIYENYKIRDLVRLLLEMIFKKHSEEKIGE